MLKIKIEKSAESYVVTLSIMLIIDEIKVTLRKVWMFLFLIDENLHIVI